MNKNTKTLPRLDLAPKLNRPLSLWNPLDYLRLLYWVFYFPQALRWYVDTFGGGYIPEEEMNVRKGLQILRENAIQRQLLLQGIILTLTVPTSFCWVLEQFGFVIDWAGVAIGVAVGLAVGVVYGVAVGVAFGVAIGVAVGAVYGVAVGFAFGLAVGLVGVVVYGLVEGMMLGVVGGLAGGVMGGLAGVVAFGVALGVAILRPDDWLLRTPVNAFKVQNGSWLFPRITTLPVPTLKKRLKQSLSSNWEEGVHNVNELLGYSYQSRIVLKAVNEVLAETDSETVIWKLSRLATNPFDWRLFDCLSSPVANSFSALHRQKPDDAMGGFEKVRHILYGEEMYILALTLDLCTQATDFNQIHSLTLPPCPEPNPEKRLRQTSWQAIEAFKRVTEDAQLIHRSTDKATRAQALARSQEELKKVLENADRLPQAEGGLIIDIATTWLDALLKIAS